MVDAEKDEGSVAGECEVRVVDLVRARQEAVDCIAREESARPAGLSSCSRWWHECLGQKTTIDKNQNRKCADNLLLTRSPEGPTRGCSRRWGSSSGPSGTCEGGGWGWNVGKVRQVSRRSASVGSDGDGEAKRDETLHLGVVGRDVLHVPPRVELRPPARGHVGHHRLLQRGQRRHQVVLRVARRLGPERRLCGAVVVMG